MTHGFHTCSICQHIKYSTIQAIENGKISVTATYPQLYIITNKDLRVRGGYAIFPNSTCV